MIGCNAVVCIIWKDKVIYFFYRNPWTWITFLHFGLDNQEWK